MKIFKFKTTMSCNGCVSKVEKFLTRENGIDKWDVNLNSPDKILTIETDTLDANQIPPLLLKAGYKAVQI